MKKYTLLYITILFQAVFIAIDSSACTSMVVSASRSASGRPLLWKHRDTGADNNFLARVEATDSTAGYVGLFNAGDSLLSEAWMGMNDRGFAIMNTASYNLPAHESDLTDREGWIMTKALQRCTTVDDFERLLEELPKPLGVQANFGVIDGIGGASYFETSDREWQRFDVDATAEGFLIRTNHSFSGSDEGGRGYIRYASALKLASDLNGDFHPYNFTENFSRSFYHALFGRDFSNDGIVANIDFIPRDISTASLVIEGITDDMEPTEIRMWGCLGYAPCAVSHFIYLNYIPEEFLPGQNFRSEACDRATELRLSTIPLEAEEGKAYIDMELLKPISDSCREKSLSNYLEGEGR